MNNLFRRLFITKKRKAKGMRCLEIAEMLITDANNIAMGFRNESYAGEYECLLKSSDAYIKHAAKHLGFRDVTELRKHYDIRREI